LCYRSASRLELSRQYWVQPGNHVRYVKSYTRSNLFTKLYDSLRTFKLIQKFCIKICTFSMCANQREFSRKISIHELICFFDEAPRANCESRTFLKNCRVRDLIPRSGGSRRPNTSRRSRVDSAGRLWLTVRESNGEAPTAALGLILYYGAETAVEARAESSKMTKNCAEQNASSGAATEIEVSELTSAFMPFRFTSQPSAGWFHVLTVQKSGDTTSGAGAWIMTSPMGTLLAFRHSLVRTTSTCFNLLVFIA